MIIALSPYFGYVLIAAALIALECIIIGFLFPGRARGKVFTESFMKQFEQVHRREVDPNSQPSKEGYPDMGSGFYSTRLPYKAWYDFNNAQRAHYNFVESIASILTLLIIGGIYYPVVAAVFGFVYFIGRIIYSIGYTISGSSGRLIGVLILDVAILALFVLSIITGYKFIRGIPPYLI